MGQGSAALVTSGRRLGHRLEDDRGDRRIEVGAALARVGRRLVAVLQGDLQWPAPVEGQRSREHLVENDAQRIEIALGQYLFRRRSLLRRDILRRAERPAQGFGRRQQRQAEVGEIGLPVQRQQDVGGLEVAVDDAFLMGVIEGGADVAHDSQRVAWRNETPFAPVGVQNSAQVGALDVLHSHVEQPARLPITIQAHNMGVLQPGDGLRLPLEALNIGRLLTEGPVDDLDRHVAPQPHILREIDAGHAALAE